MTGTGKNRAGNSAFQEWGAASRPGAAACAKHYLERIAEREKEVGAWAWLAAEHAMHEAHEADRNRSSEPLHGLILGVKDIIDTHDMPTGLGFRPYDQRRPVWDAGCVAACRQAGAVVLGKTVTTEFAYFAPGKTRNPHDLMATPGGSSSGSAAAVADGMVDAAFGSQTAGSLIRPAAYCGVIGYKASHGAFGLSGIRPLAQSFDSLGIISRSLHNIRAIRQLLSGQTVKPEPDTTRPPRLGFCRTAHWPEMEVVARMVVERAVDALRESGAEIVEIASPEFYGSVLNDHALIMAYEVARNYAFERDKYADKLSEQFLALCNRGSSVSHDNYRAAQDRLHLAKSGFSQQISEFDAWIAPSALGEAPLANEGTGSPVMSLFWTALGMPCLALPCGFGYNKRPLGIQLVSAPGLDETLLATARWVERHLEWAYRLPRNEETQRQQTKSEEKTP